MVSAQRDARPLVRKEPHPTRDEKHPGCPEKSESSTPNAGLGPHPLDTLAHVPVPVKAMLTLPPLLVPDMVLLDAVFAVGEYVTMMVMV